MFPIRDSKANSSNNKKKDNKKPITDTYYNKVSYRESRNIFSSNEPVDPENRLYTDTATHMHQFWTDTIIGAKASDITTNNDKPVEGEKLINSQITQNFLKELSKLNKNTNYTPIGCKKCGYVGHFSYECRNITKTLKKDKIPEKNDKGSKTELRKNDKSETKLMSQNDNEKLLKKKKKKEKKKRKEKKHSKDKKEKHKRSLSSSRDGLKKSRSNSPNENRRDKVERRRKSHSTSRSDK